MNFPMQSILKLHYTEESSCLKKMRVPLDQTNLAKGQNTKNGDMV